MCSRITELTSFMETAPRLRVGLQVAVVALPLVALLIAADGTTGRTMATAFEELSLVMVLLALHLVFSRLRGNKMTRLRKKLPPKDQGEDEPTDLDSGDSESQDADETDEQKQRDIGMMTTQIRTAVRVGDMVTAEATLERMQETCGEPGHIRRACWSVSYGEVVSGFCRAGKVEKAEYWLRKFVSGAPRIRPSTACVNMVTDARARRGDLAEAEGWLAQMPRMGVKVDAESYGVLIAGHAAAGDVVRAMHWLRQMRKANLVPTSESQRQVLQAVSRINDTTSSEQLIETVQDLTVKTPDTNESRAATATSWRSSGPIVPVGPGPEPEVLSFQSRREEKEWDIGRQGLGSKSSPSTPSTCSPGKPWSSRSTPSEWEVEAQEQGAGSAEPASALEGFWSTGRGETFEVWSSGLSTWTCFRSSWFGDAKEFSITYDEQDGIYWWGAMKQSWMDPADLKAEPEILTWYSADDWDKRWPVFTWHKMSNGQAESIPNQAYGKWTTKTQAFTGASQWVPKSG